jgi:hypothetical protein
LFGGDISLWLGQHLIPDEELPHRGTSQERRIEMDMEMAGFDFLSLAVQWCLVYAHTYIIQSLAFETQIYA